MKHEDFDRVSLDVLKSAEKPGPLMVYRDHWWALDKDGHALIYRGATKRFSTPQANINPALVKRLNDNPDHPGSDVIFLAWAYLPFKISDYQ